MKKIIVLLAVSLLVAGAAFSQNEDKALLAKYSKKELATIKTENPTEYTYLKYCVHNAFYVAKITQEKINSNPEQFGNVAISDINNINFYDLNIEIKEERYQAFLIEGVADKVLMVKSKKHILRELNK